MAKAKKRKPCKNYVDMAGIFDEVAALRRIALAVRSAIKESRGTGERYPSLEKSMEFLDQVYWHNKRAGRKNPTR